MPTKFNVRAEMQYWNLKYKLTKLNESYKSKKKLFYKFFYVSL